MDVYMPVMDGYEVCSGVCPCVCWCLPTGVFCVRMSVHACIREGHKANTRAKLDETHHRAHGAYDDDDHAAYELDDQVVTNGHTEIDVHRVDREDGQRPSCVAGKCHSRRPAEMH